MINQENQHPQATFRDELELRLKVFEECTEMPFIPGELEQWLSASREALNELAPLLKKSLATHDEEFADITDEDPELFVQVQNMRDEERAIAELTGRIAEWLDEFPKKMIDGGDETEFKEDLDKYVAETLNVITRIRKQEVTVRTWFSEAFNRDRGTVD